MSRWTGAALAAVLAVGWADRAWGEGLPFAVRCDRPGVVELRWKTVVEAKGYELWRKLEPGGEWGRVGRAPAGATRYVDRAVQPRTFYSYKLGVLGTGGEHVVGPIEALASFYVELTEQRGDQAVLHVHAWDDTLGEWSRSGEVVVGVGQRIRADAAVAGFDTGATLREVSPDPVHEGAVRILFSPATEGAPVEVTSQDVLPVVVRDGGRAGGRADGPGSRVRSGSDPKEDATPIPATLKRLKFPEPTRVGTVIGHRVVWDIENKSEFRLMLVVEGGGSRRTFYIGAGKTEDVRLPRGGDYTVTANASDNKIIPLYGEFGLEGGVRYKSVLGIQSAR